MPRISVKLDQSTHAKLAKAAQAAGRSPSKQLALTALSRAKKLVKPSK